MSDNFIDLMEQLKRVHVEAREADKWENQNLRREVERLTFELRVAKQTIMDMESKHAFKTQAHPRSVFPADESAPRNFHASPFSSSATQQTSDQHVMRTQPHVMRTQPHVMRAQPHAMRAQHRDVADRSVVELTRGPSTLRGRALDRDHTPNQGSHQARPRSLSRQRSETPVLPDALVQFARERDVNGQPTRMIDPATPGFHGALQMVMREKIESLRRAYEVRGQKEEAAILATCKICDTTNEDETVKQDPRLMLLCTSNVDGEKQDFVVTTSLDGNPLVNAVLPYKQCNYDGYCNRCGCTFKHYSPRVYTAYTHILVHLPKTLTDMVEIIRSKQ